MLTMGDPERGRVRAGGGSILMTFTCALTGGTYRDIESQNRPFEW